MKKLIFISAVVFVLIGGTVAFRPTSDDTIIIRESPTSVSTGGFVVDMETEVCASESPISVSSSPTATETEPSQTDQQPTVFLMMLEDGVCASLVPISAEPFNKAEINTDQQTSFVEGSTGIAQGQTAVGFEPGVWYIQH